MTLTTKNLFVGFVAGLLIGLLVYNAAYAGEQVWAYPLGDGQTIDLPSPCHMGDAVLTADGRLLPCHNTKGWDETRTIPSSCEQLMESAMRAMDDFMPTRVMVDIFHHTYPTVQKMDKKWMDDFTARAQRAEQAWQLAKIQCWKR